MAVVDSFTRLPDSGLHNASIQAKFRSTALAGLGEEPEGSIYNTSEFEAYTPLDPDMTTTTIQDPFGVYTGGAPQVGAGQPYVDGTGNMVIPAAGGGGYVYITPQGQTQSGSGALPPRGSGLTTPSQQAEQFRLYSTLIQGGLDIAKLIAIQPGTAQTPGQTIRQTPGYPVASNSVGLNAAVGGISTTTLLLLAVGAFVLMQSRQRQ